jgi:CDP-glucose 4,6-dehydratase
MLEPLSGYLLLAGHMYQNGKDFSQAWNFGPGDDDLIPVGEIAEEMITQWGEGEIEIKLETQYHEAELLKLDISKARSILNWRPVYNCKEAVKRTVLWYRQYYRNNDIMAYSIKEIEEYMERSLRQGT